MSPSIGPAAEGHQVTTGRSRKDVAIAAGTIAAMFVVYNANGREIASYDSQPTKLAARELLLRGTTSLNYVVGFTPQLLERSGFQLALDGRYRSAYSPMPAIVDRDVLPGHSGRLGSSTSAHRAHRA